VDEAVLLLAWLVARINEVLEELLVDPTLCSVDEAVLLVTWLVARVDEVLEELAVEPNPCNMMLPSDAWVLLVVALLLLLGLKLLEEEELDVEAEWTPVPLEVEFVVPFVYNWASMQLWASLPRVLLRFYSLAPTIRLTQNNATKHDRSSSILQRPSCFIVVEHAKSATTAQGGGGKDSHIFLAVGRLTA
jgi:hypothetical protein